ncbi:Protein aurora borealis [Stylophora pistillata]|uniref:Protein aurora borealis n=1 Tax=Stylophora pistillata TaxID=50429 RepID=A0A2B4RKR1_STYPI|nr:Protein aurora borealis [Stylophora pistillata]
MVDSMSSLSCSEITRNPFDSGIENRTNCPDFSPSMFSIQETPGSQKNPADIEEFPDQEYSTTFEKEEDEIAAQEKIDEYFSQNFIVPSPWTPNHEAKHVKFSPLPPATAYIEAVSSMESSSSSPLPSTSKVKADASCQTKLSLPPDFDLQSHIDSVHYNQDGLNGSKDISLSSLRRKLFTQTETETVPEKDHLMVPTNIK